MEKQNPTVAILMGSESDWPVMEGGARILKEFGVPFEARVLSAHRTPEAVRSYVQLADGRGVKVIIAGAGMAAHLAGVVASAFALPVIGVPIASGNLKGLDALLATVQMPSGVPVATVAIGGAKNAAMLALQILATGNDDLKRRLETYKSDMVGRVDQMNERVQALAAELD
jgi:phosphoribosylaminoimidazole carboxylase PurE protein